MTETRQWKPVLDFRKGGLSHDFDRDVDHDFTRDNGATVDRFTLSKMGPLFNVFGLMWDD